MVSALVDSHDPIPAAPVVPRATVPPVDRVHQHLLAGQDMGELRGESVERQVAAILRDRALKRPILAVRIGPRNTPTKLVEDLNATARLLDDNGYNVPVVASPTPFLRGR
ncbi:hypothetical protein [Rhodococcus koreensis]